MLRFQSFLFSELNVNLNLKTIFLWKELAKSPFDNAIFLKHFHTKTSFQVYDIKCFPTNQGIINPIEVVLK